MPVPRSDTAPRQAVAPGVALAGRVGAAPAPLWTFLTNHAHVLIVIHTEPDLVLREVAQRVGITERAVQRIVQELEDAGYLTRARSGRRNRYEVLRGKPLRHPVESHCSIDQVLNLVSRKRSDCHRGTSE